MIVTGSSLSKIPPRSLRRDYSGSIVTATTEPYKTAIATATATNTSLPSRFLAGARHPSPEMTGTVRPTSGPTSPVHARHSAGRKRDTEPSTVARAPVNPRIARLRSNLDSEQWNREQRSSEGPLAIVRGMSVDATTGRVRTNRLGRHVAEALAVRRRGGNSFGSVVVITELPNTIRSEWVGTPHH